MLGIVTVVGMLVVIGTIVKLVVRVSGRDL